MSEQYPPAGTTVNTAAFPGESVVGNTGPTPTGVEPFAIETAAAYPDVQQAFAPLVVPTVGETTIFEQWGNCEYMYACKGQIRSISLQYRLCTRLSYMHN